MKPLQALRQIRGIFRSVREAKENGEISEPEMIDIISECFGLLHQVTSGVDLSRSVKALMRSMSTEIVRRLHPVTDAILLQWAKEAYAAYGFVTDNKNYQGLPMPKWEELTPKIQAAWLGATAKVQDLARSGA